MLHGRLGRIRNAIAVVSSTCPNCFRGSSVWGVGSITAVCRVCIRRFFRSIFVQDSRLRLTCGSFRLEEGGGRVPGNAYCSF